MGYYTQRTLEIVSGGNKSTDYEKEISEFTGIDYCCEGETKWYDMEKDMREYSKTHPKTLFLIIGIGEEDGDMWKEYYLNGKMQRSAAVITYAPFDKKKLK